MADGVLIVDAGGAVTVYNRPAEELLGLSPGTLAVGMRLRDVPLLAPLVAQLTVAGDPAAEVEQRIEVRGRGAVRVTMTRLPADAAGVAPTLVVVHDGREAERLQSMRRDFVANVSHEVRTPLAAIRGCSATLLAGALGDQERARHFVEVIEHHAVRLAQLVDDLGRLADLEQGRAELYRRAVPLRPAVQAAINACRDRALGAGVTLEWDVAADTPPLDADRDLLDQALLRLIDNALRYTPRGGRIAVRGAGAALGPPAAPQVAVTVADTGVGIPADELPRLSERFYRPDKGRSRELGGSGLGLAVVKHIVHAHGGSLDITSTPQQGTAVTLHWPARRESMQPAVAS